MICVCRWKVFTEQGLEHVQLLAAVLDYTGELVFWRLAFHHGQNREQQLLSLTDLILDGGLPLSEVAAVTQRKNLLAVFPPQGRPLVDMAHLFREFLDLPLRVGH